MKKTIWALAFLTLGISQSMGMDHSEKERKGWTIYRQDGSSEPTSSSLKDRVILVPAQDILTSKQQGWKTLAQNNIVIILTQNHPNEDEGIEGKEAGKKLPVIMRGFEFDPEKGLKHKFPKSDQSSKGNFFKYSMGKEYYSYLTGVFAIVAKDLVEKGSSRFEGFHGLLGFLQAEFDQKQTFCMLTTSNNQKNIDKVLGVQKILKNDSSIGKDSGPKKPTHKASMPKEESKNHTNSQNGENNSKKLEEKSMDPKKEEDYTKFYAGEQEFTGKTQFLKGGQSLYDFLMGED